MNTEIKSLEGNSSAVSPDHHKIMQQRINEVMNVNYRLIQTPPCLSHHKFHAMMRRLQSEWLKKYVEQIK